jgi:hypothetical protein
MQAERKKQLSAGLEQIASVSGEIPKLISDSNMYSCIFIGGNTCFYRIVHKVNGFNIEIATFKYDKYDYYTMNSH